MAPHDMSRGTAARTLGIDLASQPRGTAACLIEWTPDGGTVLPKPRPRLTDSALRELIADAAVCRVAIDAPFGWPSEFVRAVAAYCESGTWPDLDPKRLEFRETEFRVMKVIGQEPLSAVTDWLVWPTMRCAGLLAAISPEGKPIDRSGAGQIVETYPAAVLVRWDLSPANWGKDPGSYKGPGEEAERRRKRLVNLIARRTAGWLDLSARRAEFVKNDDALDALVCALLARAKALPRRTEPIPRGFGELARREGWIHLPARGSSIAESLRRRA